MTDRYDQLMHGLYRGVAPAWIAGDRRALFLRESVRRRCALGQALTAGWRCTMFLARARRSADIALDVFAAWIEQRERARNVPTGLYLALCDVLAGDRVAWEMCQYESLVLSELLCEPTIERRGDAFRFRFVIRSLHSHATLYAISQAPAAFGRDLVPRERETFIARTLVNGRWVLDDVTEPE